MKNFNLLSDQFGSQFHDYVNFVKYMIYGVFLYLNINSEIMKILSVLMFLDTLFGIIKVLALEYKFSIKKLLWGFVTKLLIIIIPLLVALIGKGVGKDFIWAVDFTMKILIINEGLSCLTNLLSAKTKRDIQNVDLVSILLNYLRNLLLIISKKIFGDSIQDSIDEITKNEKK